MRIEIQEMNGKGLKLKYIDESLNEFFEVVEEDYTKQIEKGKRSKKARAMGMVAKMDDTLPEFITHMHFIENDKVVVRNNLPFSRMAEKVGSYKKMERGLEGYLKAKGFECHVKVMKDEKE
jgi:hypothetical protein